MNVRYGCTSLFCWCFLNANNLGLIYRQYIENERSLLTSPFRSFSVDDESTIISWRTNVQSNNEKREFEYKQVNRLFTSYNLLSVAWAKKVQTINIPTIPRKWHHVTFTWSIFWGLRFYRNGVLVSETRRVLARGYPQTSGSDGHLMIGNRSLSSGVKPANNFQIHGLTVWPRLISQVQIKESLDTGESNGCSHCGYSNARLDNLLCLHNVVFLILIVLVRTQTKPRMRWGRQEQKPIW